MMKWDEVLADKSNRQKVQDFATNKLSRRDVERVAGMRSFVRDRGASRARKATRQALKRRGMLN